MLNLIDKKSPPLADDPQFQLSCRQLSADDEQQIIQLLATIYGDTYSYDAFYKPGVIANLLRQEKLTSYGEFINGNELIAQTGFWHKDPKQDYVEAGFAMRLPTQTKHYEATHVQQLWFEIIKHFRKSHHYIHLNCTTLHPFAQRYISHFINAKPCGLILNYAADEKIRGIAATQNNMHALIMTAVLDKETIGRQHCYLPTAWFSWFQSIYQNLGLDRELIAIEPASPSAAYQLALIEENRAIDMTRHKLIAIDPNPAIQQPEISDQDTRLIHLPLNDPHLITTVFNQLIADGYQPVGLRPQQNRADEMILQAIQHKQNTINNLSNEMKLASRFSRELIFAWQVLCQSAPTGSISK